MFGTKTNIPCLDDKNMSNYLHMHMFLEYENKMDIMTTTY